MRLLYKCGGEFKLKEYPGYDIPEYAILLHTWGFDTKEITFQDLVNGTRRGKIGFNKLNFCAARAEQDDL